MFTFKGYYWKWRPILVFLILLPLLCILCSFIFFLFVTFLVCCAAKICVSVVHGYSNLTCSYVGSYYPLVGEDFYKHFSEGWSSGDEFFPFLLVPPFWWVAVLGMVFLVSSFCFWDSITPSIWVVSKPWLQCITGRTFLVESRFPLSVLGLDV